MGAFSPIPGRVVPGHLGSGAPRNLLPKDRYLEDYGSIKVIMVEDVYLIFSNSNVAILGIYVQCH